MTTVAEAFVTLRPDLSKFKAEAESGLGGLGELGKKAAIGIAAAGTAMLGIAAISIQAAAEEQAGIERLAQAVISNGGDWDKLGGTIEGQIAKWEKLTAFSDGEMRDALAGMTAITGDAEEAMKRLPIAMDFARGAGIDLSTATKLLGKVSDETTNVLARYGIHVEKGADATDVLAKVQQKFAGQSATYAKTAAGAWAIFGNQMDNLKEDIGSALLPAFTEFASAATGMIDGLREALAKPEIQQTIKTIVSTLGTIKEIALEMFGVLTGSAPDAGAKLTEALGPEAAKFIMTAIATLREGIKGAMEAIVKAFTWVQENWDSVAFALKAVALTVVVPAFIAWAIAAVSAAAATIIALLPILVPIALIGAAAFLLHSNWKTITEAITAFTTTMGETIGGIFDSLGKKIREVGAFFDSIGTGIQTVLAQIGSSIGGFVASIIGTLTGWVNDVLAVWRMFTDNPPRMIGIMIGLVIGSLLNLAQSIGDFTGRAAKTIGDWIENTKTTIWNFFTALPGNVGTWLGGVFSALGTFVSQALTATADWIGQTASSIGTFFSELPGNVWTWLTGVIASLGKFGTEAGEATHDWIGDTWTTISTFFTGLPQKMWDFAVDAIKGLIGGFGSMKDAALNAVKNLFGGIVDGIKSSLKIGSPSKVFADIGENMIKGLELGLDRRAHLGGLGDLGSARQGPGLDMGGMSRAIAAQLSKATRPVNLTVQSLDPNEVARMTAKGLRVAALEWR